MSRRMSEASLKRKMSVGDKQENAENDAQQDVPACSMHPDSYLFKGIGLLFICSIGLGNYFCYDAPGAMEVLFNSKMKVITVKKYLS